MKAKNKNLLFKVSTNMFFIILSFIFIVPIISVFSISLSNEADIFENGYRLIPKSISLLAYKYIFRNPDQIVTAYKVTVITSLIGAVLSTLVMMMCAYTLSRKCFKYRRFISFYISFTLLFNGGLIPSYILTTKYLRLQDTWLILILSGLVNVWYIFVLRTFIQGIPEAIIESAIIDGANEFRIFSSLIIPLSIPAIATIGLLNLFGYWNNWMTALLYINNSDLYPIQYLLQKVMTDLQAILSNMRRIPSSVVIETSIPSETVRMALAVVAAGPMLFIMPFFQKYFVRGMTVGSVKG